MRWCAASAVDWSCLEAYRSSARLSLVVSRTITLAVLRLFFGSGGRPIRIIFANSSPKIGCLLLTGTILYYFTVTVKCIFQQEV